MDEYTKPVWSSSVLLTIDMQEDFSYKNSPSYINGTEKVIPEVLKLVQYYRNQYWPVIHFVRLYHRNGSNVDICRRRSVEEGAHVVAPNSQGAELVSELKPYSTVQLDEERLLQSKPQKLAEQEWIIYKPRWGAFYETGLDEFLKELHTSTVVVSGCNFPNCPRTTIYEASERDYRTVLVKDAVSGLYPRGEKELRDIDVAICEADDIITNAE